MSSRSVLMGLANDKQTLDWIEEIGGEQYEAKFTHGTVYGYNKFKCRCEFCKEAKALSNQRAALKRAVKRAVELPYVSHRVGAA
ncbi:hypothetical protein ABSDF1769 [Acinetobacter baumannii SDF]|uniref:Uncharacterized protein n=1 Tax=Acinetobacter baumannii (strain SDF) TaxID=509170 RepID=B0VNN0_ACIBS|nr:hypothetical protein ABSDF1769 [Acinetobacter baumannii SDF]